MKFEIVYTNQFEKDYKKMKQRGKNIDKLKEVVGILAEGKKLDKKYKQHTLKGKYEGVNECHIEPDWLLCWIASNNRLILTFTRTGTHSDLF